MIRRLVSTAALALMAGGIAAPALAQTPPATIGERYVPAPWWMRDPVIASMGFVRTEVQANRAGFSATFQVVDRSVTDASRAAADRVRALSQALAAYGVDKVRVETTLTTRPLYDQYRDENGVLRDNVRSDRIERYQADATVIITIRDVSVLERVYATVLASSPTSVGQVGFNLEPDNELITWLSGEAVKDSANRARAAAANAGASLGPVRVIDPTGRACQTDVLAGWPSYSSGAGLATTVDSSEVVVTGSRMERSYASPPPPPPPPPPGAAPTEDQIEAARLALQPPLRQITDSACVVYGLSN
ncbi:SIMPL domain-containing protein [Brevundimonas sp.]|uniref:SIMPL domain-containing protein n=1 Tax=Brevundimonas sp. TaxID=1871086 RepID=UPI002ABCBD94|nr:SIMPL domain-containing protein [Brevundimonas sp.]MDZ4363885.1 SIMPL domain-containing protein [Brevundimonas sp.]